LGNRVTCHVWLHFRGYASRRITTGYHVKIRVGSASAPGSSRSTAESRLRRTNWSIFGLAQFDRKAAYPLPSTLAESLHADCGRRTGPLLCIWIRLCDPWIVGHPRAHAERVSSPGNRKYQRFVATRTPHNRRRRDVERRRRYRCRCGICRRAPELMSSHQRPILPKKLRKQRLQLLPMAWRRLTLPYHRHSPAVRLERRDIASVPSGVRL
jgi:hypothetical protein